MTSTPQVEFDWVNVRTSGPSGATDLPSGDTEEFVARAPFGPCYYTGTLLQFDQGTVVTAPVEMTYMLRRKGAIPQPSPPANVVAAHQSDTEIDVSWDPSKDDTGDAAITYNIYRGTDPEIKTLVEEGNDPPDAGSGLFHDTELTAETRYYYDVVAVDASGNRSLAGSDDDTTDAGT